MMGFESLSAMYRPAATANNRSRAWMLTDAGRFQASKRAESVGQRVRVSPVRRVVARFVALLT